MLSPIALFVYNRPEHTQKCLESISRCRQAKDSLLYIFSDASKSDQDTPNVLKVREVINAKRWTKSVKIIERQKNNGLAANIVSGITQVISAHKKIIVIEDDLIVSEGFLEYLNKGLDVYQSEEKVMNINAYTAPINVKLPETFFFNIPSSWGWATWERAWKYYNSQTEELLDLLTKQKKLKDFDLNGSKMFASQLYNKLEEKIDTWDINWYASVYLQNGFCLNPKISLVQNTGFDNTGTNTHKTDIFDIPELTNKINVYKIPLKELKGIRKKMKLFYRYGGISLNHKIRFLISLIKGKIYRSSPKKIKHLYKRFRVKK